MVTVLIETASLAPICFQYPDELYSTDTRTEAPTSRSMRMASLLMYLVSGVSSPMIPVSAYQRTGAVSAGYLQRYYTPPY